MEKETLNGFEVFDDFMPGANVKSFTKTEKTEDVVDDAAAEELTDEELEELRKGSDDKEEEEVVVEEVKTKTVKTKKTDKVVETEEVDETEVEDASEDNSTVLAFFGAISEKLGWSLDEEDEVPQTPEELVEYFQSVIEENSVPQYASEEVEALDNFVKNGGDIRKYFQIDNDLDLEDMDISEDENNQKLVIKEFLKEKGVSTKQIDKKLSKYEDAGLLEDEAEDALEALKEIREQKKQQLLQEQEKAAETSKKRQQDYFNNVVNEIKVMNDIRGIKIPEKDKQALLEYIFKPDADGLTKYQKDWSKSVKNLLESAYFTMKGDTLLKAAKNEGSSNAINKFKESLNRTGVSKKNKRQESAENSSSLFDSFARQLRVG